jgi:hypothetical protein
MVIYLLVADFVVQTARAFKNGINSELSSWRFSCGGSNPIWSALIEPPNDVVPSSDALPFYCFTDPGCNGNLVMQVVWKTWVLGLSVMPILSYATLSDPNFATASVNLILRVHENPFDGFKITNGKAYQFSKTTDSTDLYQWQLELTSDSPSLPLCLDNFFFLEGAYLNAYPATFYLGEYANSEWTSFQTIIQT